jgi:nitroreductase
MKSVVSGFIVGLLLAGSVYAAEDMTGKDVFSVIHGRKSVRHFTGAAVPKADLEKIVRAGMAAPTAGNMQPWSFIVVTERKTLDDLAAGLLNARMLAKAGAAIVVCTEEAKANRKYRDLAITDASVAGQNILLAIEGLGLGGVWTAANPYEDRVKVVRTILKIPDDVIPLNVIAVGVPTGEDKPKDKFKPEKIHWEKW